MKIAITSQGKDLTDYLDERFGRARYFIVVDNSTGEVEAIDNSANCNAAHGAGLNAVQIIADQEVSLVLTGHLGPKAKAALDKAEIDSYQGLSHSLTCEKALEIACKEKDISLVLSD